MAARKVRIEKAHLGDPAAIPLASSDIDRLAKTAGAAWSATWTDVMFLTQQFTRSYQLSADGADTSLHWHHLLMAVGNYKRQGGTTIRPASVAPTGFQVAAHTLTAFVVPGTTVKVDRDTYASWKALANAVDGLGIPTTTTLLSALWPQHHVIFDIRDIRAAIGIGPGHKWVTTESKEFDQRAEFPAEWPWHWYRWLRGSVLKTPNHDLLSVERALFVLDERVRLILKVIKPRWCWHEYRALALAASHRTAEHNYAVLKERIGAGKSRITAADALALL